MHKVDMQVNLGGLVMKNPVNTCSGTFGGIEKMQDFVDLRALGAVTTKGVAPTMWPGNPQPRMFETPSGVMNSIGLQNAGVAQFLVDEGPYLSVLSEVTPVIVNIAGHEVHEYVEVIEALEEAPWVGAYEINISCPNLSCGGAALGKSAKASAEVTSACRAVTSRPIIIKLTPDTGDIASIALACETAGADAISMINTIPAMAIDVHTRKSRVSRPTAGLSGPAIHPIAVRMVWEAASAISIPICAMGGITSGEDAAEFILAGAHAVSVGTSNLTDPASSTRIAQELESWAAEQGAKSIEELVGGFIC